MAAPTEVELDLIRASMRGLRPAGAYDRVFNDECMFSFDTPFSPNGLYVSLTSYQGFGADYVSLDQERAGVPGRGPGWRRRQPSGAQ